MSEIIKLENLTKKYSKFFALDSLNLTITEKGTCVGFLGPNGAGKSTTIKIMTGLIRPTSGTANIFGVDAIKTPHLALENVGVIVEMPQFFPNLTAQEVLRYFGKLRGLDENQLNSRITMVLDHLNLKEWRNSKTGTFSKGTKQRLGIASALLHDPELIILDEPTSGLDPRGILEVREIIKNLKKEGKTIFMSSHQLSEVQEVCDKVALLDKGKLIRFESIKNSDLEPRQVKIKVESHSQILPEQITQLERIQEVQAITKESDSVIIIDFSGDNDAKASLLEQIQNLGIRVLSFSPIQSRLETMYLDETSESVR